MEFGLATRRRWFGAIVLFGAVAMLVLGETALKSKLTGTAYLAYWLICFGLTGLAIVIAFLDLRALQQRVRQEHRDLLETTIDKIESETKADNPKARTREPK